MTLHCSYVAASQHFMSPQGGRGCYVGVEAPSYWQRSAGKSDTPFMGPLPSGSSQNKKAKNKSVLVVWVKRKGDRNLLHV